MLSPEDHRSEGQQYVLHIELMPAVWKPKYIHLTRSFLGFVFRRKSLFSMREVHSFIAISRKARR